MDHTVTTTLDGAVIYTARGHQVTARLFWASLKAAHHLTTAQIANALDISQRTAEGWMIGRHPAPALRPKIAAWLAHLQR
jgi:hypothetical protein